MEIGNQIKALRQRRSITQEALAQHLGVTAQAVSKWERGVATPDIGMLPAISAYFGVSIDELFALPDDTRMERIQNMLWDDRYYDPAEVENTRAFLLEKGRKEPENGVIFDYLAQMENHLAREHQEKAAQYAMEALKRDTSLRNPYGELDFAMNGYMHDWNYRNHYLLINFYQQHLEQNPEDWRAYLSIMDQLIDDYRLEEAEAFCHRFSQINNTYRVPLYQGMIAWQRGEREKAFSIWAEMEAEFPEEWCVWHNIGDYLARSGQYDKAMDYYRRALNVQKAPPMLDPLEAMAQLCEIRGDIRGALDAKKEQADRTENQWHISGEELDMIYRDIARLEKKLNS